MTSWESDFLPPKHFPRRISLPHLLLQQTHVQQLQPQLTQHRCLPLPHKISLHPLITRGARKVMIVREWKSQWQSRLGQTGEGRKQIWREKKKERERGGGERERERERERTHWLKLWLQYVIRRHSHFSHSTFDYSISTLYLLHHTQTFTILKLARGISISIDPFSLSIPASILVWRCSNSFLLCAVMYLQAKMMMSTDVRRSIWQ